MSLEYILSKFQVFLDCHFYQTLDYHKVVFWQTRFQEIVRIVVKCCLDYLRKKGEVLNNNGSAGKVHLYSRKHLRSGLMQFLKFCLNHSSLRWLKPKLHLASNFKVNGWWIPYINSGVGRPNLSKIIWLF